MKNLPSVAFLARKFQIANFLYRWFFLAILNCWTCSFEIKKQTKTKSEKFVKLQKYKTKNKFTKLNRWKEFWGKNWKTKQNLGRKEMKIFFWISKQKSFSSSKQNKTNNKKSHSLCATIMTLYNIVTITTYITIRMSHIPIHHQNLVWKKCSI